jgi:hypothetical protein
MSLRRRSSALAGSSPAAMVIGSKGPPDRGSEPKSVILYWLVANGRYLSHGA